jgi:tRNA threonylcarbamoyladenosine biosynthesis protein TsaE
VPTYRTRSEAETIALGQRLARELPVGGVVLLIGNLGAGKTTLAKGIVSGLGAAPADDVTSPTFTLIHDYGELFDGDAPVLIEWGERFPALLPARRTEIRIRDDGADEREIQIEHLT